MVNYPATNGSSEMVSECLNLEITNRLFGIALAVNSLCRKNKDKNSDT